jgi:hypothetical protein
MAPRSDRCISRKAPGDWRTPRRFARNAVNKFPLRIPSPPSSSSREIPLPNKSFFALAKNVFQLLMQKSPSLLTETPIFSQRFIKNKNGVKRTVD